MMRKGAHLPKSQAAEKTSLSTRQQLWWVYQIVVQSSEPHFNAEYEYIYTYNYNMITKDQHYFLQKEELVVLIL